MATFYDEDNFVQRYNERFKLKIDKDWSYRQSRLYILQKFLNGTIYDNLSPFHREYSDSSNTAKYVPLADRRPSVIYRIPKIIVDASISMLFGEGHFPVPRCEHENTTQFLQYITRVCDLRGTMIDAARKGSIGSVVILVKVLEGHFFFEALHSVHLIPVFKRTAPKVLEKLSEKKKVDGATLRTQGYKIPEDKTREEYYIMREWNEQEEIYYQPYPCEKEEDESFVPQKDEMRTSKHELGFVPAVWIKNLPKTGGMDGHSTFEDILDICVEIDYQLSQHGRLLKYNSDPTLVVKNPTTLDGQELVKGLGAINLDEKGDAYYLELTTGPTKSVMEYVKALREMALEIVRGNRANPDKVHSAQSGEALKMLNFELVSLVEEMRISYGEYGLQQVYCMVLDMVESGKIDFDFDKEVPQPDANCQGHIMLDWPAWYPPSAMDKFNEAKTLSELLDHGILSRQKAVETIADEYNILDVEAEIRDIEEHEDKMYDKEAKLKQNAVERQPAKVDPKQE